MLALLRVSFSTQLQCKSFNSYYFFSLSAGGLQNHLCANTKLFRSSQQQYLSPRQRIRLHLLRYCDPWRRVSFTHKSNVVSTTFSAGCMKDCLGDHNALLPLVKLFPLSFPRGYEAISCRVTLPENPTREKEECTVYLLFFVIFC